MQGIRLKEEDFHGQMEQQVFFSFWALILFTQMWWQQVYKNAPAHAFPVSSIW